MGSQDKELLERKKRKLPHGVCFRHRLREGASLVHWVKSRYSMLSAVDRRRTDFECPVCKNLKARLNSVPSVRRTNVRKDIFILPKICLIGGSRKLSSLVESKDESRLRFIVVLLQVMASWKELVRIFRSYWPVLYMARTATTY